MVGTWSERGFMNVLAGTHESYRFGDTPGDFRLGGTVIDHDELAANPKIVGDLSEYGIRIEQAEWQAPGE